MNGYELGSLIKTLEEFRKVDPEMPIQVALVFSLVANAGEMPMADLTRVAGISQASVSRNVAALAQINRFHRPGHGLLETVEDPMNRSRKIVRLTRKGHAIARQLGG